MKIPRYSSEDSVNLSSGRSLTTGTQGSNAIVNIAKETINSTLQYGAAKNSLTAKLRQLEIQTDINNAKSLLYKDTTTFLDGLKDDEEFKLKPDSALSNWDKKTKDWTKHYKGSVDEWTWKQLEPDFNFHIFEQTSKLNNDYVHKQKVINGFQSLSLYNDTYQSKIKNASSAKDILGNFELYKKDIKGYDKLLLGKESYDENFLTIKEFTNTELKMFQATEGLIILSPNGTTQIDWKSVEERLRNTKFRFKDINGKSVNADDRAVLIKDVNARKTNQESSFKLERVELGREEKGDFITEMIDIKNGKNDNENTASYAERIKNSNMTVGKKVALIEQKLLQEIMHEF